MKRGQDDGFVGVDLDVQGWEILSAHPVREFEIKSGKTAVAMMGLVDKMTGSAAVVNYDLYVEENGRLRIWTSLKALGTLGLYISGLSHKSLEENLMVLMFGKVISKECIGIGEGGEVLEIDAERAWKESGEEAGWSNEVSFEIFLS